MLCFEIISSVTPTEYGYTFILNDYLLQYGFRKAKLSKISHVLSPKLNLTCNLLSNLFQHILNFNILSISKYSHFQHTLHLFSQISNLLHYNSYSGVIYLCPLYILPPYLNRFKPHHHHIINIIISTSSHPKIMYSF